MTDSVQVLLYLVLISLFLALTPPLFYRSILVLTGKKLANSFPRAGHDGPEWYKRTMDAHANSLENLVLYAGLTLVCHLSSQTDQLEQICWVYLAARIGQTVVHLLSTAHWPVFLRFAFWMTQMGLLIYVGANLI